MDGIVLPTTVQRWCVVATFADATSRQQDSMLDTAPFFRNFPAHSGWERVGAKRHVTAPDGTRPLSAALSRALGNSLHAA